MASIASYGFVSPDDLCLRQVVLPLQVDQSYSTATFEDIATLAAAIYAQRKANPQNPLLGAAAPQIGRCQPIIFVDLAEGLGPLTLFVNPEITGFSEEGTTDYEHCPSVDPRIWACVFRANRIRLQALDILGNRVERDFEGKQARMIQHLCDHLAGMCPPDRVHFSGGYCHWVLPHQSEDYLKNPDSWPVIYNPATHSGSHCTEGECDVLTQQMTECSLASRSRILAFKAKNF